MGEKPQEKSRARGALQAPAAVLFDMDGVLVFSEESWFRAVEEAGVAYRGRAVTREEFEPTFGQGTNADIKSFGLNCTVAELEEFYGQAFLRHLGLVRRNPVALEVLEALSARGVPIALVTNTTEPTASEVLRATGLLDAFPFRATPTALIPRKPAPDLLLAAAKLLGVPVGDCWMVGDTRFDAAAARAAGATFVGLGIDGDRRMAELSELPGLVEAAREGRALRVPGDSPMTGA